MNTARLSLRQLTRKDLTLLQDFEKRNLAHLARWESPISLPLKQRIETWIKEIEEGRSLRFLAFLQDSPQQLIALINFTQIFRGSFQACYLGYKIDHAFEGKGYMQEALKVLLDHLFHHEGLHRIMANYMPANQRSARLLQRLGFEIEGYAKNYLKIGEQWEDHVLTALSLEKWTRSQIQSPEQTLEEYLHLHIPVSKSMGVAVVEANLQKVILKAPLHNNINHKKTVFGGSLHAVLTLACWSLIQLHVKNKQIVITESEIRYLEPVTGDFEAICIAPESSLFDRFKMAIQKKGKARIFLTAAIFLDNKPCVEFQARFAALTSHL